jgi:hypothetical protein
LAYCGSPCRRLQSSESEAWQKLTKNAEGQLENGGNPTSLELHGQIVATASADAWPFLVRVDVQNGLVTLAWPGLPGQNYTVETTLDPNAPWQTAFGSMSVNGDTTTWKAPASSPMRFYRVVWLH